MTAEEIRRLDLSPAEFKTPAFLREIAAQLAEHNEILRKGVMPPDVFMRRKLNGKALQLANWKEPLPEMVTIDGQEYFPK